ncbi:MAG: filamentous hemagglutinin [Burkholderiaceae bacterium]|jgi:filamentous hemagglutinin
MDIGCLNIFQSGMNGISLPRWPKQTAVRIGSCRTIQGRSGYATDYSITQATAKLTTGGNLALVAGRNLGVRGATVSAGDSVLLQVANVTIAAVKERTTTDIQAIGKSAYNRVARSDETLVGGSISATNDLSVAEQSGIQAGDGGFNVNVAGNTTLSGGAVISTQKAIDDGVNRFVRGGTLTTSDIQNQASYSATASSVTASAISGIAGNKAARTGDAGTGIQKIFDADKVQKDINAQVQITQTFGREASTAIGDYAANQQKQALSLREQAAKESDPARVQALQLRAKRLADN